MNPRLRRLVRTRRAVRPGEQGGSVHTDRTPLVSLATRVGAVALAVGASAAEATSMILRVGLARGVRLQVDVTYTSVMVSHPAEGDEPPVTMVRTVPALGRDFARLGHLEGLVNDVCEGRTSLDEATALLKERGESGEEYRRWVVLGAGFMQGASICALLGGIVLEMLVAGLATLLVELLNQRLARRSASYFLTQVAAGAIPMVLALVLMWVRNLGVTQLWAVSPSLVVASGMVSMLAGMGVVSAAQDALDGYFLTATARVVELLMRTGGLILGVAGVLWVGVRLRVPAYLAPEWMAPPAPAVQIGAAALFALALAVSTGLGPRGALVTSLFGGLAWSTYLVVFGPVGENHAIAAGVGALAVGLTGHLFARRIRIPSIALVTIGIAPLMPGMILYRGLFRLVVGTPAVNPLDAPDELFLLATLTGVGLALGSSTGGAVGRRLALPTDTVERLARVLSLRRGTGTVTPGVPKPADIADVGGLPPT